ncbi:MAG: universal stress protein [bacterium]
MYQKIHVPIDNSEDSHKAMEVSISLAKAFKAKVIGSHVYAARLHDDRFRLLETGLPARFQTEEELEKQRKIHDKLIEMGLILISDSYLDVFTYKAKEEGVQVERRMLEGIHYEQLAKDINNDTCDLVVLGAHGIGYVKHSQIGSVTARLARRIVADMWVCKNGSDLSGGKTLVAVDGSPYSYSALRKAITLAKQFGANVEVVSAFDPAFHHAAFLNIRGALSKEAGKVFKFEEQEELHNNIIDVGLEKVCQANLLRAQKLANDLDFPITTRVLKGKPFDEILNYVEETAPDLMVFGRYGAHHVEGADLGSHAENLLRQATCSVLMVGPVGVKPFDIPILEEYEEEGMEWDDDALRILLKAPPFAQGMAKTTVERYAREKGYDRINKAYLEEALRKVLPAAAKHLMGLEVEDPKIREARKMSRSPISEYLPGELQMKWTDAAKERLAGRVPTALRPMVTGAIERYALEQGIPEITEDFLKDISRQMGYTKEDGSPGSGGYMAKYAAPAVPSDTKGNDNRESGPNGH